MNPTCPNPACDSQHFTLAEMTVAGFHDKPAAVKCAQCNRVVTVLDTKAQQELYENTRAVLEELKKIEKRMR